MGSSSHTPDRFHTVFDHDGIVPNAGLLLPVTLAARLGVEALIDSLVKTGSANPGRKLLTLVFGILAGGNHIDHVDILRAGATRRILDFVVMAPSTVGTFLRSFTFGHTRQLDAVIARLLQRAWDMGCGPDGLPLVIDLDSTICPVHSRAKQGASFGYTEQLGYHPLLATRAGTGEILAAQMRKGSAGSARGVVEFTRRLIATLNKTTANGTRTVRADSAFWNNKLIELFDNHGINWSITISQHVTVKAAIDQIPEESWTTIDYNASGHAQVAETRYVTGGDTNYRRKRLERRLIVRRTKLPGAQQQLFTQWRHHAFITNRNDLNTIDADEFHRHHAVVELAIKDAKNGAGLDHFPSGHYAANAAWLAAVVIAHNLSCWTTLIPNLAPINNTSRRNRLFATAAVLANRSGKQTLRYPARWPWETDFNTALSTLRDLPARPP